MFKRDGFWAKVLTVLLTVAMTLIATPLDGVAEAVNGTSDAAVVQEQGSEKSQDTTSSMADQKGSSDSGSGSNTSEMDSARAQKADGTTDTNDNGTSAVASSNNNESAGTTDTSDSASTATANDFNKSNPAVAASNEASANETEDKSTFKAYWTNAADSETCYTNSDYSASDVTTQRDYSCTPNTNTLHKSTMKIYLKLAGDSKTIYKKGSVKIELPVGFYRGLDTDDPLLAACSDAQYGATRLDQIDWMIPEAPSTNSVTDFNYAEETKEVDGQQVKYYVMQNYKDITGATELDVNVDYRYRPTMLDVKSVVQADGNDKGVYQAAYPVVCSVNSSEVASTELSVKILTKVNPAKVTLTHATQDNNKGIYFTWNNSWGTKPADSDKYFYIVWYVTYQRAGASTMPYKYMLSVNPDDADGGELVGVKKYAGGNRYDFSTHISIDPQYTDIANNPNLLNQLWTGIGNSPTKGGDFSENYIYDAYLGTNSVYNTQIYALLYRYPMTKISDAVKNGTDMTNDGISVSNGLTITDTWQDGHTVTTEVKPTGDLSVKALPAGGGLKAMGKAREDSRSLGYTVDSAQSFLAQGLEVTLPDFELHSYDYDEKSTWNAADSTYKSSTSFDLTDGKYYAFSSDRASTQYYGKKPGIDTINSLNPQELSDEDYSLDSFYITDDEYDGAYINEIGWQRDPSSSTSYDKYQPIEIWIRKAGDSEFVKYGQIVRDGDSSYTFTNANDGTVVSDVNSKNRVAFPTDAVEIEAKQVNSPFYASDVNIHYSITIHPSATLASRIQKDIDAGLDSVIGGFASGTQSVEGNTENSVENAVGNYWHLVSYQFSAISSSAGLRVDNDYVIDNSANSERVTATQLDAYIETNVDGNNSQTKKYANLKYLRNYIPSEGVFYVLLPAGTYVKDDEVLAGLPGNLYRGWNDVRAFVNPVADREVKQVSNWEGTGRTMLMVRVHIPDQIINSIESVGSRNTIRLVYKLHDTYTNIDDRGGIATGSAVFIDTSKSDIFDSDVNEAFADWDYYKDIVHKAWTDKQKAAAATTRVDFGNVTALESGFDDQVETENEAYYEQSGTAYIGDEYIDRLHYKADSNTRTDNIVLYDTFSSEQKNAIGSFESVDISSIDSKVTYDADDSNTTDTCKPVVYYTTVTPTDQTRSLDSGIWTTTAPDDLSMVKAIAIDCRKTDSGKDFVLNQKGTLVAYVHMKATSDSSRAGRTETNEASISKRMFVGTTAGASAAITTEPANRNVTLLAANVGIEKTCDPKSGTQDHPAEIGNDANKQLTYTLTITNKATDTSLPNVRDVHVTDQLPDGLSLDDPSVMSVESDSLGIKAGTKIGSQSSVSYQVDGNKLEFDVSKLPSNGTVTITIPVVRKDPVTQTTDYTNTATIDKVGKQEDYGKRSTTYHRTSVTAMPLSGASGFDGLIAAGGAVLVLFALAWIRRRRHNGEA
ncbi:hypothetical protein VXJ24_02820 [Olsenella sp. YH-ols2221]|uniref:hypothetical protein n=1 Tax=Olsenella kribbiana TaxID=3115221 RepID=UPI002ED7A83E